MRDAEFSASRFLWQRLGVFLPVQILVGIYPAPAAFCPLNAAPVTGQQPDNVVDIDPYLRITFLLALVEYQFQTEMQMHRLDVVDIFPVGIAGSAHKADDVPRLHGIPLGKPRGEGRILLQMGVIIVAAAVKAADAHPPAAVSVPAHGLHHAALHRHDRRSQGAHQVVAQVLPPESKRTRHAEIVTVTVAVPRRNGGKRLILSSLI